MMEAWNLKQTDNRSSDSLPTFIIFCEDEVSEPIYFKFFETATIKVNIIKGQKSNINNVIKAIDHCIKEQLMILIEGIPTLINDDVHVWCVYDRDRQININEDTYFNESIEMAKHRGIKVAWSNDAFELWVLLHFMDIDPNQEENEHRAAYYEKLTEFFKKLPQPNEQLVKCLTIRNFNYKDHLKREKNFRNIVRPEMIGKTQDALKRAKGLEEFHNQNSKPYHEKTPCTLVHHLLIKLLELGGKK